MLASIVSSLTLPKLQLAPFYPRQVRLLSAGEKVSSCHPRQLSFPASDCLLDEKELTPRQVVYQVDHKKKLP